MFWKNEKYSPFGEIYTLVEVKKDSDRSLIPTRKKIINKLLAKLHKANEKYFGTPINCALMSVGITVLITHLYV